jgi:hypothetical protein
MGAAVRPAMNFEGKTRSAWGMEQTFSDESSNSSSVDYLRALKNSNRDRSADPAFPDEPGMSANSERRQDARYKCEGSAELQAPNSSVRTWATITDLSRGGCYLEMQATFPADTLLSMVIEVRGIRFRAKGVVRICYPFLGMGMVFTDIPATDQARLNELLLLLASSMERLSPQLASAPVPATVAKVANPAAALDALKIHFAECDMLTREDFLKLIADPSEQDLRK